MFTAELKILPLTIRLAAMEALWDLLTHDILRGVSPPWHAEVLGAAAGDEASGPVGRGQTPSAIPLCGG